ncbi:hypothetical protein IPC1294_21685 [Pseudomonas aeruginosa]|nr:hypothetical protein IPC1294_21685 [Pseudomonas aeruginosa]
MLKSRSCRWMTISFVVTCRKERYGTITSRYNFACARGITMVRHHNCVKVQIMQSPDIRALVSQKTFIDVVPSDERSFSITLEDGY